MSGSAVAPRAVPTGGKVALAYVHPDIYEGRGDPSLTLPAAMPGQGERYLRFLDDELKRIARQVLGDAADDLETHVVRGEPVQQIEKLAKEKGIPVADAEKQQAELFRKNAFRSEWIEVPDAEGKFAWKQKE